MFLLSAWVKKEAHSACSPEQMKQLACSVRIQHLSPLYLLCVLPELRWFQDADVIEAFRTLALQSALNIPPRLNRSYPAAWNANKRSKTSLPESAALAWDLGPQELQELEAAATKTKGQVSLRTKMLSPDSAYLDGVAYKLSASKYADPEDAAKATFGLFLTTDDVCMEPIIGSPSPGQRHQPFRYLAELSAGNTLLILNNISPNSIGRSNVFDQSGSTLREVLAPHRVEGRLALRAVIKSG